MGGTPKAIIRPFLGLNGNHIQPYITVYMPMLSIKKKKSEATDGLQRCIS